jgi:alpha-beta hydrolase superfamily lysophospholipase
MEKDAPADVCCRPFAQATYTGLGEREHLASPSNDLETHIEDLLDVIKYEDVSDPVLIGHSHGGMVAIGRLPGSGSLMVTTFRER